MTNLLPSLKFTPIIKPLPWGGYWLKDLFNKELPAGIPCGESWEVVDLPQDQSVVSAGPLAGTPLSVLVCEQREALLGEAPPLLGRFPVLFKLIDARQTLSVQVHPDQEASARLGNQARPKTEAWYILQAGEGAKVFLGLKPGIGSTELAAALEEGTVGELLLPVEVRSGDFVYLPAGTLHTIGAGIVLAEVQQASDTTYRVFDWNRVGLDGRPRPLHLPEALASIHFDQRGKPPHLAPLSGRPGVRCKWFSFERIGVGAGGDVSLDGGRARILFCLEGSGTVSGTGTPPLPLQVGQSCLVPACRAESLTSGTGGVFLLIRV